MPKTGYVYILSNNQRRIYTGVTSELRLRVKQHKNKTHQECFTARYNIDRLVYYEVYESINQAIARESAIKDMHRKQKIQMIVAFNPTWRDLSESWDKPGEPFDESRMRPPTKF